MFQGANKKTFERKGACKRQGESNLPRMYGNLIFVLRMLQENWMYNRLTKKQKDMVMRLHGSFVQWVFIEESYKICSLLPRNNSPFFPETYKAIKINNFSVQNWEKEL